jgi:hypothetical protein
MSMTHWRPPGHPDLVAAQRNLATLVIAKCITKTLAGKPALTDDQVQHLTDLLAGS